MSGRLHLPVILFFAALLALGLAIHRDYGISWDEPFQRFTGAVTVKHLAEKFAPSLVSGEAGRLPALAGYIDRDHGTAFEAPAVALEALLGPFGWRAVFLSLGALSVAAAALIFFVVPERALPGEGDPWRSQVVVIGRIFARPDFWRLAAPLVLSQATFQALQGLWFAPWLADVHGLARGPAADYLFFSAAAYMLASFALGPFSEWAGKRGVSQLRIYQGGMIVCTAAFAPLAFGPPGGVLVLLVVFAASSIAAVIAYTLLTHLVPAAQTGRVTTASNLLLFGTSFGFQWGVGAILGNWPSAQGRYDPEGYRVAFGLLLATQAAATAWLLTAKETRR